MIGPPLARWVKKLQACHYFIYYSICYPLSWRVCGGWLGDYVSPDRSRWHRTAEYVLAQVGQAVNSSRCGHTAGRHPETHPVTRGRLVPFAATRCTLVDGDSDRLCDRYQISYARRLKYWPIARPRRRGPAAKLSMRLSIQKQTRGLSLPQWRVPQSPAYLR